MNEINQATKIGDAAIAELKSFSGFDDWWWGLCPDDRDEIRASVDMAIYYAIVSIRTMKDE